MKNARRVLSAIWGVVFSAAIIFGYMPLQTTAKEIIPMVKFIGAPKTEYFAGDRVEFNINASNYGGKVEYRVVLWNDSTKSYSDLWNASNGYPGRYYTKWQPSGNTNFTLGWPINEPGSYRITVYAKRVGIKGDKAAMKGMNCDSYVSSVAFVVKSRNTQASNIESINNSIASIKNNIESVDFSDLPINGRDKESEQLRVLQVLIKHFQEDAEVDLYKKDGEFCVTISKSGDKVKAILKNVSFIEATAANTFSINKDTGEIMLNPDYHDYLKNIIFPCVFDGVEVKSIPNYDIGRFLFNGSVLIPRTVEKIGDKALTTCLSLSEIKVDKNNPIYSSLNGVLYSKDMKTLLVFPREKGNECVIPDTVEKISKEAIRNCLKLSTVKIPQSTIIIEEGNFSGCKNISSYFVSSQNPVFYSKDGAIYSKKDNELLFFPYGAQNTAKGNLSTRIVKFNIEKGTNTINISKDIEYIEESALKITPGLLNINVDPENPYYSSIDGVLFDKKGEKLILYPNGRKYKYDIPYGTKIIGKNAFYKCIDLWEVSIPASVNTIEIDAFYETKINVTMTPIGYYGTYVDSRTTGITKIKIDPKNETYCSIDGVIFDKTKKNLVLYPGSGGRTYTIPEGTTTICESAFTKKGGPTYVIMAKSVNYIGKNAFYNCSNLSEIEINDNTLVCEGAFELCSNIKKLVLGKNVTLENNSFPGYTQLIDLYSINGAGTYLYENGIWTKQ